ncbi:NAD(P)H-dependent oxidoreductase [Mycoplasma sp. P36-A1]|uniref:NAD(P)H-dependent oxidoreductase n=1 Tax=Mycoplasma sp. P36-A1 TaxID=3252900 RepID=UPI003C2CED78
MSTLVIAGSNSINSINQLFATQLAVNNNYEFFDTRMLEIPLFNPDIYNEGNIPYDIIGFNNMLSNYHNIIICFSIYNNMISPFLLSFFQWLSCLNKDMLDNKNIININVTKNPFSNDYALNSLINVENSFKANILENIFINSYELSNDYSNIYKNISNLVK